MDRWNFAFLIPVFNGNGNATSAPSKYLKGQNCTKLHTTETLQVNAVTSNTNNAEYRGVVFCFLTYKHHITDTRLKAARQQIAEAMRMRNISFVSSSQALEDQGRLQECMLIYA